MTMVWEADPTSGRGLRPQALAGFHGFRRFGWRKGAAALAEGLVHDDGAGDGDVERADTAGHGDAQEVVAGALDEVVETGAFAAEDEAGVLLEVEVGVVGGAALVEADDPDVGFLEGLEGASEVDDLGDADVLGGTGGAFGDDGGQGGGAALGDDDAVDAGAVGGADEGAEVVGVFYAVEGEEEAVAGGTDGGMDEVFEGEELALAQEGDDALVHVSFGVLVELDAGFGDNADLGGAGEVKQAFHAGVAAGFALAGDGDVVNLAGACAEGLFDRVQTV